METKSAFCPRCETPVQVTVTAGPTVQGGQATLRDAEVVCLDFHDKCTEGSCPLYGLPGIVMGVRLARSGIKPLGEWDRVTGVCSGCSDTVELEVLDETYAYCPACGTTNEWQLIKLDDESHVAVMQKKWEEEGGPPY
jgi:Zn finger protein HypA/HybF involved in hydrogenase expression